MIDEQNLEGAGHLMVIEPQENDNDTTVNNLSFYFCAVINDVIFYILIS